MIHFPWSRYLAPAHLYIYGTQARSNGCCTQYLGGLALVAAFAAAASSLSSGRLTPSNSGGSLTPINDSNTDVAALLAFMDLLLDPLGWPCTEI